MPPRANFLDIVHRVTVTGLAGVGIWGLWLTAAVWKSRRDDRMIQGALGKAPTPEERQSMILSETEGKINPPPAVPS